MARRGGRHHGEPLLAQAAQNGAAQLGVVLRDQDSRLGHSSRSMAPSGIRPIPRMVRKAAIVPAASADAASIARNTQGTVSWLGGGSNTCCSIATSISETDRKSTRLNSSHGYISYAVFCLK